MSRVLVSQRELNPFVPLRAPRAARLPQPLLHLPRRARGADRQVVRAVGVMPPHTVDMKTPCGRPKRPTATSHAMKMPTKIMAAKKIVVISSAQVKPELKT